MDERLIVDVARVGREGEELSGVLDDAVLDIHDEFLKPFGGIRYELGVMLFGRELLVRGRLEQDFTAACSRCGEDFDFSVKVPDFTHSVETDEKTEFIDLTDEVRECIILGLPNYPVCDPECPGLPSMAETVPDDRWNALDQLKQ